MNYATKRLLDAANASLTAWEGEEESVREEHAEIIEELESAIRYFDAHGATQPDEDDAECEECGGTSIASSGPTFDCGDGEGEDRPCPICCA